MCSETLLRIHDHAVAAYLDREFLRVIKRAIRLYSDVWAQFAIIKGKPLETIHRDYILALHNEFLAFFNMTFDNEASGKQLSSTLADFATGTFPMSFFSTMWMIMAFTNPGSMMAVFESSAVLIGAGVVYLGAFAICVSTVLWYIANKPYYRTVALLMITLETILVYDRLFWIGNREINSAWFQVVMCEILKLTPDLMEHILPKVGRAGAIYGGNDEEQILIDAGQKFRYRPGNNQT
jgi:hypothetical protein